MDIRQMCKRIAINSNMSHGSFSLDASMTSATSKGDTSLFNETGNYSGEFPLHPITEVIETYMIPIVCCLGLIGNSVASIVFLQKSLRGTSSGIFLAARGISDNAFLSTLLIIWISRTLKLQLGALSGSCSVIIFLSYVCGCISVWLVVFVTIENYIRICKPFVVNRLCKPSIATGIVCILCVVTVAVYSFPFWAMNPDQCIPYSEFYQTVHVLVYTDTVITLVIPFVLITALLTAIVGHLIKSCKRRNVRGSAVSQRLSNAMAKVTKMLLAVTVSFLLLNFPSHVNRIRLMVVTLLHDSWDHSSYSTEDEAVQQITLLVYYVSLSANIIVYLIFGRKFRKTFKNTFCRCNTITQGFLKISAGGRARKTESNCMFV